VRDTGVGIPSSLLPRIFDLFVQGESAGHGRQGLGVGLALTKQFVELHDGRIEARSEGPGHGSTFTIRMPVVEMASVRAEPADSPPLVRVHRRVLVVDDNQEAADMISALVQSLGGDVRAAHGGEDGVRCAAEFNPDVILLDLGMPDMDGFETCRRLRAHAFGRHAFVVALTGWSQPQDRERARASGFDAFMTKPADAHALAELLARARRQESPAANA
jgi:CheY-like chemotaxis protein